MKRLARTEWRLFFGSFALAAAALVAILLIGGRAALVSNSDSRGYLNPAAEMIRLGTFSVDGVPEIVRTPGYPLFLAPFTLLPEPLPTVAAAVAQCLIAGVMTVLTFRIAVRFAGRGSAEAEGASTRAGIIAAVLFMLSPMTLYYSSMILTERLFSFVLLLACMAVLAFLERPSVCCAALAGLLSAGAAFVRPAAMYMPLGVIGYLVIWGLFVKKFTLRRTAAFVAAFALCSLSPVFLWEHRNYALTGFRGFAAVSALNMYFYNSAPLIDESTGVPKFTAAEGDNDVFPRTHRWSR
jgi:4-amino-4-deoxy-L-arabinose transferase-like glycosyltransferase